MRYSLSWLIGLAIFAGATGCIRADQESAAQARQHALLVGCTHYASLEANPNLQLEGPGNDVILMRKLLVEHYGFPPEGIVTLAETEYGGQKPPTRENIREGFERLAREVRENDQVVILLSGHGSQQPDQNDPPEEADGLDETFLPCDIGRWDGREAVERAIVDDEIGAWLKPIQDTGASVWLIVDSCHSGTLIRGNDIEKPREVRPEDLGIPDAALNQARARAQAAAGAERTRGHEPELVALELPGRGAKLVALYAAQSSETAPELPLPRESSERKYHGLLTFTINEVLNPPPATGDRPAGNGPALTYRQLIRRIHARYSGLGRSAPTPLLEGPGQDQPVLGRGRPDPSPIALAKQRDGGWAINAGSLNGLTPGSILAVGPVAGKGDPSQALGYVEILKKDFRPLDARVEPLAHEGLPRNDDLPDGGLCRPVFLDFSPDLRLTVAVDPKDNEGQPIPAEDRSRLDTALQQAREGPIEVVDDPGQAQWLLRLTPATAGKVYLVPSTGWLQDETDRPSDRPPVFGPVPEGQEMVGWLTDRLARIARVESLKRIVTNEGETDPAEGDQEGTRVKVEMLRYTGKADKTGQLIEDEGRGLELHEGEIVGFRLTNTSPQARDVTLLFVDGGYGVTSLYPLEPGSNNRLEGKATARTIRFQVSLDTVGSESVVAIAVRAKKEQPLADFSFLEQPTIERVRGLPTARGEVQRGLESPLGQLLQNGCYGSGHARGLMSLDLDDYEMHLLPWRTTTTSPSGAD